MNELPRELPAVKTNTVATLLTQSLRYLDQTEGGMAGAAQMRQILPYLRAAMELASNRRFLVPAPQFVRLAELDNSRRQFSWGIPGKDMAAPDIVHAYPETIHVLFLSTDGLQLYDEQGKRVAAQGATGGDSTGVWYFLQPMEAMDFAVTTNYEQGGIPTRYWLQRSTPYNILHLDTEPYDGSEVLYAVATFPLALPESDDAALNYQLNLQTGHYTYLWAKTAWLAAKQFGGADDVVAFLSAIVSEAQRGVEMMNYDVENIPPETAGVLSRGELEGLYGGGKRTLARALSLRY